MISSIDLTNAEWNSLRELRNGPLKRKIPVAHQMKLIDLGFAKKLFESIVVTDKGRRYHPAPTTGAGRRVEKHSSPLRLIDRDGDPTFIPPSH